MLTLDNTQKEVIASEKRRDGYSLLESLEYMRQADIHRDSFSTAEQQKEIVEKMSNKLNIPKKYHWRIYNHMSGYLNSPYQMNEDGSLQRWRKGYAGGGLIENLNKTYSFKQLFQ